MRLLVLAVIALLLAPAAQGQVSLPLGTPPPGAYVTGTRALPVEGTAPVTLWYPAVPGSGRVDAVMAHGRFPLVLCDAAEPDGLAPMAEYLASHGFVVAVLGRGGDLARAKARLVADEHVDPNRVAAFGVGQDAAAAVALAAHDPQVRAVVSLDGEGRADRAVRAAIGHFYAPGGRGGDLGWLEAMPHAERLVAPYRDVERLPADVLAFLRETLNGAEKHTPDDAYRLPAEP